MNRTVNEEIKEDHEKKMIYALKRRICSESRKNPGEQKDQ